MAKRKGMKYTQIIDAAVIVIAEHGYHQAQVSKIAKQAGVADGTIYLYFKNKEDLLVSLFREKMGQFVEKIEKEIEGKSSIEEKLYVLVQMHFKQLSSERPLAIVTQLELRQSNSDLRNKINEVLKPYFNVIDRILVEGKETGTIHNQVDIRLARQMIFGTLDETVTNWVMKEHKYDLVSLARPVYQLLMNGFRNRSTIE